MKDYKPRPKAKPTNIGNTLMGIFIGLLLGLLMAAAIAIYMMKSPFPWSGKSRQAERAAAEAKADPGTGKGSTDDTKLAKAGERGDKPRFDFYRILPGQDSGAAADSNSSALTPDVTKTEPVKPDAAKGDAGKSGAAKPDAAKPESAKADSGKVDLAKADAAGRPTFSLQAGAFQNPAEADNVKAKLALLGLESNIETVDLPDRGTWYRVRMGPYKSLNEVNRVRSQLAQSGIDVSVVRNNPSP